MENLKNKIVATEPECITKTYTKGKHNITLKVRPAEDDSSLGNGFTICLIIEYNFAEDKFFRIKKDITTDVLRFAEHELYDFEIKNPIHVNFYYASDCIKKIKDITAKWIEFHEIVAESLQKQASEMAEIKAFFNN